MTRWLILLVIFAVVATGVSGGCVLVVADDDVAHDIKVERNQSRLARNISDELDDDPSLRYSDIDVSEDDGIVTLHGEVDSVDSLQYAVDVVARYAGVDTVVSHLTVKFDL